MSRHLIINLHYSIILAILIGLYGCHSNNGNNSATTSGNLDMVDGIDVSNHNGSIDWNKVASDDKGIDFVYIKSTEGATYSDPRFIQNAKGAARVGLHVGAYHYFRRTSSAQEQYKNFKRALDSVPFDLVPMVDVETRDKKPVAEFQDSLAVFIKLIEDAYGIHPAIYGTNRSYSELCGKRFDVKYPLYIGRYGSSVPVVPGKSHYTVWQYSEKGRVDGIEKNVDLCRFHPECSLEDLKMPSRTSVEVIEKDGLTFFFPSFERIDLITGVMPDKTEKDVIFVCEAAFTGQLLEEFDHFNIAGHHVSNGTFYEGYNCQPNTGCFTWDRKNGWHFSKETHASSETPLKKAARNGGMGFCQNLIIDNGVVGAYCFREEQVNRYRALCELNGKLCVIDCSAPMPYGDFVSKLKSAGVSYAIYCDMGTGWNYSWYRDAKGDIIEIFPTPGEYTTNWVAFYK